MRELSHKWPLAFAALGAIVAGCGDRASKAQAAVERPVHAVARGPAEKAATPAAEANAARELPPEIARWAQNKRVECERDFGGRYRGYSKDFPTGDFNGDGKTDYILSFEDVRCDIPEEMGSGDMGRWGPGNDFLISGPRGHRLTYAFNGWRESMRVGRRGERDVLLVRAGGSFGVCGDTPAEAVWAWNGQKMAIAERRNSKGGLMDREGCPILPKNVGKDGFPPILRGYYAVNGSCHEAASDPSQMSWLYLTTRAWLQFDGGPSIKSSRQVGPNVWRLTLEFEDEAGNREPGSSDIHIASPHNFTSKGVRYQYCVDEIVPASYRSEYADLDLD